MFEKVFGGPLVQLVEHDNGRLVFRSKRSLKLEKEITLKVAGQLGKPAKVKAEILTCRALDSGGFVGTARIGEPAHQRELSRLGTYSLSQEPGLRQSQRTARVMDVRYGKGQATTVDISSGGLQIESNAKMEQDEVSLLKLTPDLSCEARVAWVKDNRAGLEFWKLDDATRILLSHFAAGRAVPSKTKPKDIKPAPVKAKPRLDLIGSPDYDSLD